MYADPSLQKDVHRRDTARAGKKDVYCGWCGHESRKDHMKSHMMNNHNNRSPEEWTAHIMAIDRLITAPAAVWKGKGKAAVGPPNSTPSVTGLRLSLPTSSLGHRRAPRRSPSLGPTEDATVLTRVASQSPERGRFGLASSSSQPASQSPARGRSEHALHLPPPTSSSSHPPYAGAVPMPTKQQTVQQEFLQNQASAASDRPHVCPICSRSFTSQILLGSHRVSQRPQHKRHCLSSVVPVRGPRSR